MLTLLAQAPGAPVVEIPDWLQWLFVVGEPSITDGRAFGGILTWAKVLGLFCLLAWVAGWLLAKPKGSGAARPVSSAKLYWLLAVLGIGLLSAFLGVLDETERLKLAPIGRFKPATLLAVLSGAGMLALVEWQLWSVLLKRKATAELVVLVLIHAAFLLGTVAAFQVYRIDLAYVRARRMDPRFVHDWTFYGPRLGATFAGLVVLARMTVEILVEVVNLRPRRLYAIAWQSVVEAIRRMWAPWVVLALFIVILAFTHWFLRSGERDAELSRMYVVTLTLVTTGLLLTMVGIVAPISLPTDIRTQTIYTIVSKPVRRLELIWGRLIGYMALVTVLVLIFGVISLAYIDRTVGGRIEAARALAVKYAETKPEYAKLQAAAADQLATRLSARVPVKGTLTFRDAKGQDRKKGIDVGQEQDIRSHVEGATPARAIWQYGVVPDPFNPGRMLDRRVPVSDLLKSGTIEWTRNRLIDLMDAQATASGARPGRPVGRGRLEEGGRAGPEGRGSRDPGDRAQGAGRPRGRPQGRARSSPSAEAAELRREADELHSPPIAVEMTFNIYRTTKGTLGEPVLASLRAYNPRPGARVHRALFPVREYYTNRQSLPADILVGSHGFLTVEIGCETPNQYLGMAEPDFYILSSQGGFRLNFMKGLFGIWVQAMVLTAIGLFAGSFLSWPVALLTTIFFFLAGELAFGILAELSMRAQLVGGGSFESLVRLLGHQNMMNTLAPTPEVIAAKTADTLVVPVMSRLVYLIPNFGAMDVTNAVSDGFAVTWKDILNLMLLGLGYALPFSVAGYLILKNREVAA